MPAPLPTPAAAAQSGRLPRARILRGHLVRMVLWVLCIDAVAVAVYYTAHLSTATTRMRGLFTLVWSVVTMVVVLTALRRIRISRRGGSR